MFFNRHPRWLALLLLVNFHPAEAQPKGQPVMTWIPPYSIEAAKKQLGQSFGGQPLEAGISHLGLQFWAPTRSGGLELVSKYGRIQESTIEQFRQWGQSHGVRVLLCVFNGAEKWDWPLARAGFAEHPEKFIQALCSEVERLNLDGIDVDLEGNQPLPGDKEAFVAFTIALSKRLHAAGKVLTLDSFAGEWNAPNQTWWSELLPHLDALTSMGYLETGARAKGWQSYAEQKKAAGPFAGKLLLGLPSDKDQWLDTPLAEHLEWIRTHNSGLAIWDIQFPSPAWRSPETWQQLKNIRGPQ